MKEKTELRILEVMVAIVTILAIIALAVSGCGGSTEMSTATTVTVIPAPVCVVANNQICAGDSAVFYDNNLNADMNYYGSGVEYVYILDGEAYAANGSIDTFETYPLSSGVYYVTLEITQVDQYGNYVIYAVANCPAVSVYDCD
jgi:Tfp pilus assembly protein PilV